MLYDDIRREREDVYFRFDKKDSDEEIVVPGPVAKAKK